MLKKRKESLKFYFKKSTNFLSSKNWSTTEKQSHIQGKWVKVPECVLVLGVSAGVWSLFSLVNVDDKEICAKDRTAVSDRCTSERGLLLTKPKPLTNCMCCSPRWRSNSRSLVSTDAERDRRTVLWFGCCCTRGVPAESPSQKNAWVGLLVCGKNFPQRKEKCLNFRSLLLVCREQWCRKGMLRQT